MHFPLNEAVSTFILYLIIRLQIKMNSITQLSKEEAARCFDRGHYLNLSDAFKAEFQLRQEHLCMPFNVYQQALEASLGRSIATNELSDRNRLIAELEACDD